MYNARNHKKAVIVDLDGTLTDSRHRAHLAKEGRWDEFHEAGALDKPVQAVVDSVNAFAMLGYQIVIFTGRPEKHARETIDWLDQARVTWNMMEMRRAGIFTPNEELKRQWYRAYSKEFQFVCAFEDQQATCVMWKSLGLTVFKVELDD
jgi:beta-phosphoglucomutase-like phosphatase (HAD superfamily)